MKFRYALAATAIYAQSAALHATTLELDVLSFNVWHSDTTSNATRDNIVNAIRASGATIVGLQELNSRSHGEYLRSKLGAEWYLHHTSDLAYLSRFRIIDTSTDGRGAKLEIAPGHELWLFNAHLSHAPYGPYQLAGISYYGGPLRDPNRPEDIQAVIADQSARAAEARQYVTSMSTAGALATDSVLVGDFNEPSHLDWTVRAKQIGLKRAAVAWPSSAIFANAGLKDAYRTVFADETSRLGSTWSPHYGPNYRESHYPAGVYEPQDRIDLIYFRGERLQAVNAGMLGPVGDNEADISSGVGTGYSLAGQFPSDHRAVFATLRYSGLDHTRLTFAGLAHNPGNSNALNAGYGDATLTTPHVTVRFQGSGGAFWDSYDSRRDGLGKDSNWHGGVAQLQGGGSGRYHELVLTPAAGHGVRIESFRLLDYMNWSSGHYVNWSLRTASGSLLASGLAEVPANGVANIATGVSNKVNENVILRFEHLSGDNTDLAVDDIVFR